MSVAAKIEGIPVGLYLAKVRCAARMSQERVGQKASISQSTVSKTERGERTPSENEVLSIVEAIGTPKALELPKYLSQEWKELERPAFNHPEQAVFGIAESALQRLRQLRGEFSLMDSLASLNACEQEIRQLCKLLQPRKHQVAFIGNPEIVDSEFFRTLTRWLKMRSPDWERHPLFPYPLFDPRDIPISVANLNVAGFDNASLRDHLGDPQKLVVFCCRASDSMELDLKPLVRAIQGLAAKRPSQKVAVMVLPPEAVIATGTDRQRQHGDDESQSHVKQIQTFFAQEALGAVEVQVLNACTEEFWQLAERVVDMVLEQRQRLADRISDLVCVVEQTADRMERQEGNAALELTCVVGDKIGGSIAMHTTSCGALEMRLTDVSSNDRCVGVDSRLLRAFRGLRSRIDWSRSTLMRLWSFVSKQD